MPKMELLSPWNTTPSRWKNIPQTTPSVGFLMVVEWDFMELSCRDFLEDSTAVFIVWLQGGAPVR